MSDDVMPQGISGPDPDPKRVAETFLRLLRSDQTEYASVAERVEQWAVHSSTAREFHEVIAQTMFAWVMGGRSKADWELAVAGALVSFSLNDWADCLRRDNPDETFERCGEIAKSDFLEVQPRASELLDQLEDEFLMSGQRRMLIALVALCAAGRRCAEERAALDPEKARGSHE